MFHAIRRRTAVNAFWHSEHAKSLRARDQNSGRHFVSELLVQHDVVSLGTLVGLGRVRHVGILPQDVCPMKVFIGFAGLVTLPKKLLKLGLSFSI